MEKRRLFHDSNRLKLLTDLLRNLAVRYGWKLEAWCVLSTHYHMVAHSPSGDGRTLPKFINHLHAQSARELNRLDNLPGRQVWFNYRETLLTIQTSYLARLNYTHQNAVHHKRAAVASEYPWCSATEFELACTPAWVKTIYSFKTDKLNVDDDFD